MKNNINWKITISDGDGPFGYLIENGTDDVSPDEVAEMIHKFLKSESPLLRIVEKD
jgi:hypothetical protein